jgi:hypothetical protein
MTATGIEDREETILEYVVHERLTKEQLAELLVSLGGQKTGSRDDLADRLLAIKGLRPKDALSKLSLDDLKLVVRRFGVPEPPKPATPTALLGSFLSDERSSLMRRIEDIASKQRPPIPRGARQAPTTLPPVHVEPPRPVEPKRASELPSAAGTESDRPPEPTHAAPATPATSVSAGLPVFQETRDWVGAYKFAYQWDSEDLYEAELLGSLRGRFGPNNAVRQQGESGRVYDIVVRNSARIEVKLPKAKAELDRMIGQVRRYLSQHPGGVIVVIIGFQMKNQQEIHNAQEELESAGAAVFVK